MEPATRERAEAILLTHRSREVGRSLRAFVPLAWGYADPSAYVSSWHLDAIAQHLEAVSRGQIRDLLITMPPRHGKSSLVSVLWPAWEWCERPRTRFLTASYALQLSTRDALKSRRVIASPWYQRLWPKVALAGDENMKSRYSNTLGGYRLAVSVGSSVTGEGGDILVIDDPHHAIEAQSEVGRESVREWWGSAWSTRGNDPRTVRRVVVQQRVHERDLAGLLLEQGGWVHLNLPAEYESARRCTTVIGWEDPRKVEGQLLSPERFGRAEVDRLKRELGSYAAAGQLQQRPAPAEGGLVKRAWWKRKPRAEFPRKFDEVLTTWDLAFKGGANNDATCGYAMGRAGGHVYILGCVHGRLDFPTQLREVEALARRWPGAVLVEDAANGAALVASLHQRLPGLIAVRADRSKEARVSTWLPWLESGNIWLPDGEAWADDLVEEAAAFPRGANDDRVDAAGQGIIRLLGWDGRIDFGVAA